MIQWAKNLYARLRQTAGPANPFWYEEIARATVSGIAVNEAKALTYSAVWACTRLITGVGASIPLHLFRAQPVTIQGVKRMKAEHATGHPLNFTLRQSANEEMDAVAARALLWNYQINWGNGVAEKTVNDYTGETRLYPLPPWHLTPDRDPSTREFRWKYYDEFTKRYRYLYREQVFHVRNVITEDGIVGKGTIQHARETIGAGIAAERFGANAFKNVVPPAYLKTSGKWDDTQRRAFRNEWDELYNGPDKRRIAVVGGDGEIKPLNLNHTDMQFLESRQNSVEEIARWYGAPPHMIQRMVQVTYNNVEVLPIDFIKFTMMPLFVIWEQAISSQLLDESERSELFAKHAVTGILRGDSKARSEFYKSMVSLAIFNRNDVLELEDMNPVEGGETYLVQGATVPLDDEGRPESDFAGTAQQPGAPAENPTDTQAIAAAVKEAMVNDLQRMATKEGNAALYAAKQSPGTFVNDVDAFYEKQRTLVADCLRPHIKALNACGVAVSAAVFVDRWIDDGKEAILETSGTATLVKLEPAVREFVNSGAWTDRPLQAVLTLGA